MAERTLNGQIEFDITAVGDGEAQGEMTVGPGMLGPFGTVQIGALVWFAEAVATSLVLGGEPMTEGTDSVPIATTLDAHLLAASRSGMITARSHWLRRDKKVSTVRTELRDGEGRRVLDLTSTYHGAG